ncbi:hypothetical protein NPX13_g1016 [Xylaria arbuscula]|uniref:Uncharacterized protein n=1 Tax=Xylaria arbuscula TaxID=114810 RepID=A0A9W8TQ05_9PEZI|nr:hypothetical protein NPX13_g1016 [Xylaria arbuscula]
MCPARLVDCSSASDITEVSDDDFDRHGNIRRPWNHAASNDSNSSQDMESPADPISDEDPVSNAPSQTSRTNRGED